MKKIKSIVLACSVAIASFTACSDTLDINTDPLSASSADPNVILPYVFVQHSARKVTELGTRICDVSQYISATFNSPRRGNVSGTLSGNTWGMLYSQILGNLQLVINDADANGASSNNVNAIAKILSANAFYEATSIWGDVPFTEALNGVTFPSPKFDSQETVLNGVVGLLDESIALIDAIPATNAFIIDAKSDMYYGGDMNKWRILANSLKLRSLMLLKSGGADVTTQINAALSQPLMQSNSEAAFLEYAGGPGASNGTFTIITAFFGPDNESQNVFGPGDPIDNLLNGSGDPRWDLWVARNTLPTPGNGVFPDTSTSVLSNNIIRATLADVLMQPAEIDLYKAQLALEGFATAGSAMVNYQNGIKNSIEWWGKDGSNIVNTVSDADIALYLGTLATPTINDIYNEQYLASFLMPVLAWNNVRRNKVPLLAAPPGSSIPTILKRFNYPPDEIGANVNTPSPLPTNTPMWFENL
jgi:hypothetical protein